MPKLIFVDHHGTEREVEGAVGESVMEVAIKNEIPGVDAECGGACACATCHVYVDQSFIDAVGEAGDMERSMLDFTDNVRPNSRLSCQIILSDRLNNLRVTTPESQF